MRLLARCSVVIGENGSFADLCAWFGNVPLIVTSEQAIDWGYYAPQRVYTHSKYLTHAR
jgi:hypothetical protein